MSTILFESLDGQLLLTRYSGGVVDGMCYQVTWGKSFWQFHKLEDAVAVRDALLVAHKTIKLTAFHKG